MKILYVFGSFGGGGTEHHFRSLLKARSNKKVSFDIFIVSNDDDFIDSFSEFDCKVIFVDKKNISKLKGWHLVKSALLLFSTIRQGRYDVVHTFFFLGHLLGTLFARSTGVKVVISNREDTGFTLSKFHFLVLRIVNRYVDKIVSIADFIKNDRQAKELFSEEKSLIIYNGVDTSDEDLVEATIDFKAEYGFNKEDFIFINVANMNHPVKGQKYLIEGFKILADRKENVILLLVGDGKLRSEYESLADDLGLSQKVLFLGFRKDVARLLRASDSFVMSSLSEGLSIAILEAMQAGLPVVATEVGGNPELIENNKNGLLVQSRSSESLYKGMAQIMESAEFCAKVGQLNQQDVKSKFSISQTVLKYDELYTTLINSNTN